ncbi:alpha/beta fold hydrolase [Falsiroseomonas sp. E2-1-a4]|uniref:alpha/beta fold hydrolase n=1 Tax=Falsiroseomonas sp. E2-1-a4 TaxID=3239299 RepID=UPI003F34F411
MSIILLHGIGGPSWNGMVPGAIDWPMPGFCGTAALPEMTFPALADALRDALDARGLDRVTLVGHSMGGMLAQEFVARFPERVAKLVLYGTTPAFGGRDPSFAEQFLAARLGPLAGRSMEQAALELMAGMLPDTAPPDATPRALAAMRAIPEDVYRATLRCLTTFDRRADLPKIAVPTLLIAGERDQAAPSKTMQRMADAIPGAEFVLIPGAGHLIHLEAPAPFLAALLPFLER